jgi:hypothetical protein
LGLLGSAIALALWSSGTFSAFSPARPTSAALFRLASALALALDGRALAECTQTTGPQRLSALACRAVRASLYVEVAERVESLVDLSRALLQFGRIAINNRLALGSRSEALKLLLFHLAEAIARLVERFVLEQIVFSHGRSFLGG